MPRNRELRKLKPKPRPNVSRSIGKAFKQATKIKKFAFTGFTKSDKEIMQKLFTKYSPDGASISFGDSLTFIQDVQRQDISPKLSQVIELRYPPVRVPKPVGVPKPKAKAKKQLIPKGLSAEESVELYGEKEEEQLQNTDVNKIFEKGAIDDLTDVRIGSVFGKKQWKDLDKDRDGLFDTPIIPDPESIGNEINELRQPLPLPSSPPPPLRRPLPLPSSPPPPLPTRRPPQNFPAGPAPPLPPRGPPQIPMRPPQNFPAGPAPPLPPRGPPAGRPYNLGPPGLPPIPQNPAANPVDPQRSFIPTAIAASLAAGGAALSGAGPVGALAAGGLTLLNDQLAQQNGWSSWRSATSILSNPDVLRIAQQHLPAEYVRLAQSTAALANDENPASATTSLLINGAEVIKKLMSSGKLTEQDTSNLFLSAAEFGTMAKTEGADLLQGFGKEALRGFGKELGNSLASKFQQQQITPGQTEDSGTANVRKGGVPGAGNQLTWNRDFGPFAVPLLDAQTDIHNDPTRGAIEQPMKPGEIMYGHGQLRPDFRYLGQRSIETEVLISSKAIARSRNHQLYPESSPYDIQPIPTYERVDMDRIRRESNLCAQVRPGKMQVCIRLSA